MKPLTQKEIRLIVAQCRQDREDAYLRYRQKLNCVRQIYKATGCNLDHAHKWVNDYYAAHGHLPEEYEGHKLTLLKSVE